MRRWGTDAETREGGPAIRCILQAHRIGVAAVRSWVETGFWPRESGTVMSEKGFLVADGNRSLATVAKRTLRKAVLVRLSAQGGSGGHTKAQAEAPELLILDMATPDVKGCEIYHTLRREPATEGIPGLVPTAGGSGGHSHRSEGQMDPSDAGAADFLIRPAKERGPGGAKALLWRA